MKHATPRRIGLAIAGVALSVAAGAVQAQPMAEAKADYPAITPLPELKIKQEMVELGKYLFFDVRLSGDAALSCATCHAPDKGWGDGMALSKGYPASEYFRNAPSLINAGYRKRFMWDGRLDGSDMGTVVRDMITEAHTMNADGRLVQERVKQVPEYVAMWETAVKKNDDPNGMRIFNVVGEFVKTIQSKNVPFDAFLKGESGAIGSEAKDGYALFTGKANCISCHNGPALSDGKLHKTGVPENPAVWNTPLRAITMLRHYSTSGMPNYMNARTDVGSYAITKDKRDIGKFNTPGLRDLKYTAPYMHNGMLASLSDVVEFYNAGGGMGGELKPLNLTDGEKKALVAFLESLSGDPMVVEAPKMPAYKPRTFGKN